MKPRPRYGWHGSPQFQVGSRVRFVFGSLQGQTGTIVKDLGLQSSDLKPGQHQIWSVELDDGGIWPLWEWTMTHA